MIARALLSSSFALTLAACVNDGPSEPYAFVGSWECGDTVLSFTNTSYNDGTKTYPIKAVSKNGQNYTLFFANGQRIGLGLVTATGLTRISGSTGGQLNCRRMN
jgi:hypothetical protein